MLDGEKSGRPYLVRHTYAATSWFGGPRVAHYRLNELDEDLRIGEQVKEHFRCIEFVLAWLKEN